MEKYLFKLTNKIITGKFIALMFLSLLLIAMLPILRPLFKDASPIFSALGVLFIAPITIYFLMTVTLGFIYIYQVLQKRDRFFTINDLSEITVKKLSRALGLNTRAAFFLLEMAARNGDFKRSGNKAFNYIYVF